MSVSGGSAPTGGANSGHEGRHGFEPGEVVVLGDRPETLARVQSLGFRLIEARPLGALGLSVLKLGTPAGLDSRQAVALLHARLPGVTADVNSVYGSYETEEAQVVSLPAPDYARRMIRWSGGEGCGSGLRIGMIDSGLAAGLPAFAGRKLHQRSFLEAGRVAADPAHGTAIAALLVGAPDPAHPTGAGLLPDADLYAASVFARQGAGQSEADAFAIAEALDWMVQKQVRVVNVSLAGDDNELMALAVRRASARGTVLIAAAGNAGPHAPPAYPGALPEVIAVTAVDQQGAVFAAANRGSYIAFAAPGVRIWVPTPDGQGRYETGTSLAAPFALGTAALEMMQGAPADADSLRLRLAAKARALGSSGRNPTYGYGLVQASASCGVVASVE
jgi:subtilisin family serine protease